MSERGQAISKASAFVWCFALSTALAIYLNGAPQLIRAGFVILASLFLGLLTKDLIARSQ